MIGSILLALGGFGLVYLGVAIGAVARFGREHANVPSVWPAVTVLKPLHGAEPGLFENLASFCGQDYDGEVQIVFGVQSARDPAIAVVGRLREAFPDLALDLVEDATLHGSNRKVSNLVNMSRAVRHGVVILADSDMIVGPGYLRDVVAALGRPGAGAVTCLYHGVDTGGLWSRLARLAIDTHFLPSVAVGVSTGLAKPCFGSTIALRRETLDAIGGFRAFADDLADDNRVGAAVRQTGGQVAIPGFTIGHACPERSASDLLAQELRWTRTIRQVDPAGHAGSLIAHPLPFGIAALVAGAGLPALALVLAAVGLRIGLCLAAEHRFALKQHPYWLVPARDLLSFGIYVASFFGRGVSWRGHSYDVTSAGVMTPKDEVPNPR